jgi:uncharacterized protein with von Willebrand factor type A (vWA) domain
LITYHYSEYFPEDNSDHLENLMKFLSEIVLQNDINLEDALKYLIEKGYPFNLFLKEKGMDDLLEKYIQELQNKKEEILNKFTLIPIQDSYNKELNNIIESLTNLNFTENENQLINESIKEQNSDMLSRFKWSKEFSKDQQKFLEHLNHMLFNKNLFEIFSKSFSFKGSTVPTETEALKLFDTLKNLEDMIKNLKESLNDGNLFNLDLEKLATILGVESFQEFLERRDRIFEKIKELLKNEGRIVVEEDGNLKLSTDSIKKISNSILNEIFSNLKTELNGAHQTQSFGDSENQVTVSKPLEFGDNISNIDFPTSIINSIIRTNNKKPSLNDIEVFLSRGYSKSSTVILLDMSGSMSRSQRFYNAKKVSLAIDSLIKREFKDDSLTIIGFGTLAKIIKISELPYIHPYPVTIFNPYIKLKYDFNKISKNEIENHIPLYFTNLQKGLNLARKVLSSNQIRNKQIILITDGAPTAHFKNNLLHINYPPSPSDFEESLNEVKYCTSENIIINTFLLTSEWDMNYFGEKSFIQQFASISKGRIFYPQSEELNKIILFDFINQKKKKFYY